LPAKATSLALKGVHARCSLPRLLEMVRHHSFHVPCNNSTRASSMRDLPQYEREGLHAASTCPPSLPPMDADLS
jgi:hypothetical protein